MRESNWVSEDTVSRETRAASPLVSVVLMAGEHAPYVAQAIEAILMQVTDFDVELVIGADRSHNATCEIVEAYALRHPDKIRLLSSEARLGDSANLKTALLACKGSYIALCDSHDVWTAANKLQAQVSHLEEHTDCSMCFHSAEILHPNGEVSEWAYEFHSNRFSMPDVLNSHFVPRSSILMHNRVLSDLPDWLSSVPVPIWALTIHAARHGNVDHLNGNMSREGRYALGDWSSMPWADRLKQLLETGETILTMAHLDKDNSAMLDESLDKEYHRLLDFHLQSGHMAQSCEVARAVLKRTPFRRWFQRRNLRLFGISYFPNPYSQLRLWLRRQNEPA